MSQSYTLLSATDRIKDSYTTINNALEALRSGFQGDAVPSNPVVGQRAFVSGSWYTYTGSTWAPDSALHNHADVQLDAAYTAKGLGQVGLVTPTSTENIDAIDKNSTKMVYLPNASGTKPTTVSTWCLLQTWILEGSTNYRTQVLISTYNAMPFPVVWHRSMANGTWSSWVRIGNSAGEVAYFARNLPPAGWLKCNGAAISRTSYYELFSTIGTSFGAGDGSTTFNVPDLRGEFVRCWDDSRGIDQGRSFGSFQNQDNSPHNHSVSPFAMYTDSVGSHSHGGLTVAYYRAGAGGDFYYPGSPMFPLDAVALPADGGHYHSLTIPSHGSNYSGNESRPRNISLLACIKY